MRTTLTLDPDTLALLREEAHRTRKSFKEVVNDAIRRGLAPRSPTKSMPRYRVRPHDTALAPGVDRAKLNQLVDELSEEAFLDRRNASLGKSKKRAS